MSENKDYTSHNQTPIAASDAVFSVTTRDEALRILKKTSKHSIIGLVMQPIQNAVAGWLNIEFWSRVQDWDKTIKAREIYNSGILDQISKMPAANNSSSEELKKAA
jgi:hypothetical protein